jgi:glycosyltransferase involved in cell wall biosynthesis
LPQKSTSCVRHRVLGVALAADVSRFSEATKHSPADTRRRLGLDPDRPLVGIVGRLQRWKGMHVYAEAMSSVLKEVSDCQGIIVGGKHHLEPYYADWLAERIQARAFQASRWSGAAQRAGMDAGHGCCGMPRNANRSGIVV